MTKLIPFDKDKWEKGSSVVRRDGKEVLDLFFTGEDEITIFQIYRLKPHCLDACSNHISGKYSLERDDPNDLFLEVELIDYYIGIMKNGLTSQAVLNKEDVRLGWDAIVKVSLDSDTFEQINDEIIHPRHYADHIVAKLTGDKNERP